MGGSDLFLSLGCSSVGLVRVDGFDEGLDVLSSGDLLWAFSSFILLVDGQALSVALRLLHDASGNHEG